MWPWRSSRMWKLGFTLPFGESGSASAPGTEGASVRGAVRVGGASDRPAGTEPGLLPVSLEPAASACEGVASPDRRAPPVRPSLIDRLDLFGRGVESVSSVP